MKTLILLFVVVLLTACQTITVMDVNSAYYTVATGSRLVLRRELSILPHTAGVSLQYGKVMDGKLVDVYYPNCRLEVRTITETAQTIQPDTFVISKVVEDTEVVQTKPITLAVTETGANFYAGVGMRNNGGPSSEIYITEFWLSSKSQPDVLRMTCQHWEDPHDGNHVTIDQIRSTLGKVFILELI
jgi:hypothetical protein